MDLLETNKVVVDFVTKTLSINSDNAKPIVCSMATNAGYARASKFFKAPSNSESVLEVKVSRRKTNDMLLEPSKNLSSLQLSAAKSLVHIKHLRWNLKVLNPTGKDILIPQNKVLAVVSEIDSKSINNFDAGFKYSNV